MNVLVIAPHPDDESLGCGGALALHVARGEHVEVVFLTSGELGLKHLAREEAWRIREDEARRATSVLGITSVDFLRLDDWCLGEHIHDAARSLRPILRRAAPRRIYLPHEHDDHPDHQASLSVLRAALSHDPDLTPEILTYEVWTPLAHYDLAQNVTSTMALKLRAIRCYRSQLVTYRYDRAIAGLNRYRGTMIARCRYAEVFQTVPLHPHGLS